MIKSVNAVEAVADFVGCDPSEVQQFDLPYYGMEVFSIGNKRYAVGTDKEADEEEQEHADANAYADDYDDEETDADEEESYKGRAI